MWLTGVLWAAVKESDGWALRPKWWRSRPDAPGGLCSYKPPKRAKQSHLCSSPGTDPETHALRPHFFVAKYFHLENGSPWDFPLSKAHPQRLHEPRLTPKLVSRLCCFSSVPGFPPVLLLLPPTCSEAAGAVSRVGASLLTDSRWAQ